MSALHEHAVRRPHGDQPDARVREERRIETGASGVVPDVGGGERTAIIREIELGQTRAVRHHDRVASVDAVFLRHDDLAQPVVASHPVADVTKRAPEAAVAGGRYEHRRVENLRSDVGVLAVFGEAGHGSQRAFTRHRVTLQDPLDGRAE